jgi:DNA-binding NtrC family response regulator
MERAPGGGETILLVEDDSAIRAVMRRGLELKGYQVCEAADGAAGLVEFRNRRDEIQLVISDIVMPNLGGRQMADAIRLESPTMPLLFTSGYSSEAFSGDAERNHGVHFLPKPWKLTDLLTLVRRALDR